MRIDSLWACLAVVCRAVVCRAVACLAVVCLAAALLSLPAQPASAAPPAFIGLRVSHPIEMDGTLDDPAWQQAQAVSEFFEVYPHALAPSPFPTEVRILYDDEYLYVGIEARDPRPELIRGHFVRRDRMYSPNGNDHLHLYLDALNTGRSSQMFAINIRNNQLDGFWSEDTQSEDYSSNFNWTSASARTAQGWTAVIRIPFSSLRYRPGPRQVWKLIVWRGAIRDKFYQEASTKIPNGANCLLCYANDLVLEDFPAGAASRSLSVSPELTYTHSSDGGNFGDARDDTLNAGGYLTWQPRAGTILDATWNPDFSQVESDDFQPTANNQFALLYPEKRPFFLESSNLLESPLQAIYTRSISEPQWGLRLTQQTGHGTYTLLASEDNGSGSLIEPGRLSSTTVAQPGESLAGFGRYQHFAGDWRIGGLFTWRNYRDGGRNLVVGPDLMWTPSNADRVRMQYLFSTTRNPHRPDLLPSWQGQSLDDHAVFLDWSHGTDTWWWETAYRHLGEHFRAWEGFIPQVGIDEFKGSLGYNFYPREAWVDYVDPQLLVTRTVGPDGDTVLQSFAPALTVSGSRNSNLTLAWHPDDRQLTAAGPQRLNYWTLGYSSNPGARLTYLEASLRLGENADFLTGDTGSGPQLTVKLQAFPLDRLELDLTGSWQRLDAQSPLSADERLFDETGVQLRALWFFSNRMYVELSAQSDVIRRNADNYALPVSTREEVQSLTLLYAWEPSPRTHVYVGCHTNDARRISNVPFDGEQTRCFVKMAYEINR